jgi:hypothetical protein
LTMIVGVDLGSARVGLVAAPSSLPLDVAASVTIHVDPKGPTRLNAVVDRVLACVRFAGARQVAIEHAALYAPVNKGPAALAAIAHAHEVCAILEARLRVELDRLGVAVHTLPRASWAHRVVPNHRGGIPDALANAGLQEHLAPGSWTRLVSQDERDAAGAILGVLLPAPRRVVKRRNRHAPTPPKSTPTPEQIDARRVRRREQDRNVHRALRGSTPLTDRPDAGCSCTEGHNGGGRHRSGCPLAPDAGRVAAAVARGSWLR